ncbi:ubiA prenyltransferase domain-containing protein 1 isoform X3 [Rhinatrema bivittatum]|uniref:ubiA prenyltransferase domain-containing protein 1 isoform X3 n=1 Tax=Rhinatrema bivittatum TaxID=194408 RepID=UPI00112D72B7|nr:ubiA prenyltransferase domain-containing protein 1 isoform X3 [Rhinatrema bivittatum]XP_029434071.1 ubiA prenyltransferase domain-containing protein 1 isoform X3 [Rhinatrema bivittatum]XP_029434072.1 ubiA prenyltransferase domain-containing protein 1 isoform X3 [Rhinatrema bivittatum]XP_029434074.1 ubiA prenyltransferase domain-containing protein 1 isoform X3 [Rhinatrema bivittatum]XP_029434075.1 ubiA prenyltransferase domain-containing protein 1 isoform X3 [Rhinatrema bivittatum]
MALTISNLPDDVIVEILSLVPAAQLIHSCKLVCVLWKNIIDLPTLWKRKSQQEGFASKACKRNPHDWRTFYFISKKKKNLLKNACADEGLDSWTIQENGGNGWKTETLPGNHGRTFHDPQVLKYFVTSYGECKKSQIIDLKQEGYWEELMDEIQPEIEIKDWYAARHDCGCQYQLCVQLLSQDYIVCQEFHPDLVVFEQWSDAEWREITHRFRNYGPGVRYICFQHGGQDTQFWRGWYGVRLTGSSVTVMPEELM